jgi:hypothetical protein
MTSSMHIQNSVLFTLMMYFFFSHSIDQHFKHLHTFFHTAKQNGLVVSKTQISLFQTRVCFLDHYICQSTVTPIERSLTFTNKFPDKITDKTQL